MVLTLMPISIQNVFRYLIAVSFLQLYMLAAQQQCNGKSGRFAMSCSCSTTRGRHWYHNGRILNKLNTFYDFIDCVKHLVNTNSCSPDRIVSYGASAGGLLVVCAINVCLVVHILNFHCDSLLPWF
jgi:cephalosporin-C deacetylase-like acetyl esterase